MYVAVVWVSALKMEAVCYSETLVSAYKPAWRYNPEQRKQHKISVWIKKTYLRSEERIQSDQRLYCIIKYEKKLAEIPGVALDSR
jgi:hypothetical protein